jgi:hypothetical protein
MHSDGGVNKPVDSNENEDITIVDMGGVDDDEQTIVDITFEAENGPVEKEQTNIFGFLIIRSGEHRGRVFQVKSGTTYIEDLKTINKTYINGKVITKPTKVKQDDLVLIGETEFEFKVLH